VIIYRQSREETEMQNTLKTRAEQVDAKYAPHGCISGWVYVGHLVVEDDGDEVEVIEAVRCRRCQINQHHERF
jgi:hypothetical protein